MKKIIIGILSLAIIVVGAFSLSAFNKNDNPKQVKSNISVKDDDNVQSIKQPVSIDKLNAQKENIFNNILNAIDYYDTVSGKFETTLIVDTPVTVTYAVDIPNQLSIENVKGANEDIDLMSNDSKKIYSNNNSKEYRENRYISQYDKASRIKQNKNINEEVELSPYYNINQKNISAKRVQVNEQGQMEFYYRQDLTNTGYASTSIYPQNLVFGFMSDTDFWNVSAVETYLGRQVIVVKGETSDKNYADKLNVTAFVMKFDIKTGILLDFKGTSAEGQVSQYLTTKEIKVDEANVNLKSNINEKILSVQSKYRNINQR